MKFNEEPLNEMHGEDEEAFIQRKMGQGLSQTTAKALYDTQKTSRDQDTARFDARDLENDVATQKANQSTDQSTIDRLKSKTFKRGSPRYKGTFYQWEMDLDCIKNIYKIY